MRAKLEQIKQKLRARMHDLVAQTGEWLKSVVQGYFNYHAVPGNLDTLGVFRERVTRLWRRVLLDRSQMHRLPWTRMHRLAVRWIPQPRMLHPYPECRFAVRYLRQEPYALNERPYGSAGDTKRLVSLARPDEVDMAASAEWRGWVTGLRLDPVAPGSPGEFVDVRYISRGRR